jgi:DNA-directed RNA polymerase subunit RPC12/RpoP
MDDDDYAQCDECGKKASVYFPWTDGESWFWSCQKCFNRLLSEPRPEVEKP